MLIGSYIGVLAVTNMLLATAGAERRTAERALSESEKRFRAVTNYEPARVSWYFEVNTSGTILHPSRPVKIYLHPCC